jgi:hypothetical protein
MLRLFGFAGLGYLCLKVLTIEKTSNLAPTLVSEMEQNDTLVVVSNFSSNSSGFHNKTTKIDIDELRGDVINKTEYKAVAQYCMFSISSSPDLNNNYAGCLSAWGNFWSWLWHSTQIEEYEAAPAESADEEPGEAVSVIRVDAPQVDLATTRVNNSLTILASEFPPNNASRDLSERQSVQIDSSTSIVEEGGVSIDTTPSTQAEEVAEPFSSLVDNIAPVEDQPVNKINNDWSLILLFVRFVVQVSSLCTVIILMCYCWWWKYMPPDSGWLTSDSHSTELSAKLACAGSSLDPPPQFKQQETLKPGGGEHQQAAVPPLPSRLPVRSPGTQSRQIVQYNRRKFSVFA